MTLGVTYKTIASWIGILEASYIIFRLEPYYKNYGKRVIKSPKIYFYDPGLLCYLLGIDSIDELKGHFAVGQIFENLVIGEVLKNSFNTRSSDKLYFWRDTNKNEVNLIIDQGVKKVGVEIKSSQTYASSTLKGVRYWLGLSEEEDLVGKLVYTGDIAQKVDSVEIVNWKKFVGKG